jgi:hypothetical protein
VGKANYGGSGQPFSRQHWTRKLAYCKETATKFSFAVLEEVVDYLSSDKLVCLECGQEFRGLANHVTFTHKYMSAKDYKIKYNIPVAMRLVGENTANMIAKSKTEQWRDPDYAEKGRINLKLNAGNLLLGRTSTNKRAKEFRKKPDPEIIKKMQAKISYDRRNESEPKYIAAIKMAIDEKTSLAKACKSFGVKPTALWAFVRLEKTSDEIKKMYERAISIPKNAAGITGVRILSSGNFQVRYGRHCKTVCNMEDAIKTLAIFKSEPNQRPKEQ